MELDEKIKLFFRFLKENGIFIEVIKLICENNAEEELIRILSNNNPFFYISTLIGCWDFLNGGHKRWCKYSILWEIECINKDFTPICYITHIENTLQAYVNQYGEDKLLNEKFLKIK